MTLDAGVMEPGTNRVRAVVRIEAELSPDPRFYWRPVRQANWHEADSLQEATARALGYRDLSDALEGGDRW